MKLLGCRHKRLSHPVANHRHCIRCGKEFPFDSLTLTSADRDQGAKVVHEYDRRNVRNLKAERDVLKWRKAK